MKFKSLVMLTAAMLFLTLSAGNAKADFACQLYVERTPWWNDGQPVSVGEDFGYGINIGQHIFPGPPAPNPDYNHFTIVFYGSKNGVPDIDPQGQGEPYPGVFARGFHVLDGYYNPGGAAGTYERYAVVRWPNGGTYCTTNSVTVVLQ